MAQGWFSRQLESGRLAAIARPAALILAVGTFLAILGPFASGSIPWPQIWFYWVGFIAMGSVFGFGAGEMIPRLFPQIPEPAVYAIMPFFVAIPVTGAIFWLEGALSGDLTLMQLARVYGPALVISGFVTAVAYAVHRLTESRRERGGAARPGRALIDKLPHNMRNADIYALTAEDHYLRVRSSAGETLILMRLTDAIAACEALDGARTHRSWWVAREAVSKARKGDGRGTLTLVEGSEAPVSRTYYPALREAGWF